MNNLIEMGVGLAAWLIFWIEWLGLILLVLIKKDNEG